MNVVSLGYGCVVKHQCDISSGSKATQFFDWLITDFDTVLFVFERMDNPVEWLDPKYFTTDDVYCNIPEWEGSGRKIECRLTKLISVHDVHDLEDIANLATWYKLVDTLRRRLERVRTIMQQNPEGVVHFIHMVEDEHSMPSAASLKRFVDLVSKYRPRNSFRLHVLLKPGFDKTKAVADVGETSITFFQMEDTGSESNGWQMCNLNWHEFFMFMDADSSVVRSTLNQNSSFVDKVKARMTNKTKMR